MRSAISTPSVGASAWSAATTDHSATEPTSPRRAPIRSIHQPASGVATRYAIENAAKLEQKVYAVPEEIDNEIARLKLATLGIDIDELTEEQARYLASWDEGT